MYSIEPSYSASGQDNTPTSNCTFVGSQGFVAVVASGTLDMDGPQVVVSARCNPVSGSGTSSTATLSPTLNSPSGTAVPTQTSIGSAYVPPYPTGSGYYPYIPTGTSYPTASFGPLPTGFGGGSGSTVLFTGDAVRAVASIGVTLLASVGVIATL